MDREEKILRTAIEKLGARNQSLKAVEECAELQAAILHFLDGRCDRDVVFDEIADVTVMCRQLRIMFGSEEVDRRVELKMERLRGLVEG